MLHVIDLGSGPHPKADADVRVDYNPWPGVTVVHDLTVFPYPFDDACASKVYLGDVIEHFTKFDAPRVISEISRILAPGGVLDITCPDFRWIFERVVYGDWNEKANVEWLRRNADPWDNAMDYLFGGWRNPNEYMMPGMGHVNGYDFNSLQKLLLSNGFCKAYRQHDNRNPAPARDAVLRIIAHKE